MDRTVVTTEKFIGDVVSRLVKHYNRIQVERDKENNFMLRVVATCPCSLGSHDDFGSADPIVPAGFGNPPPNCT